MKYPIPPACDDRRVVVEVRPCPSTPDSRRVREATVKDVLSTSRVLVETLERFAVAARPSAPASAQHCVRLAEAISQTVLEAVTTWPR